MSKEYVLGGGNLAGARLNFQHAYTRDIFDGHLLDPSIITPPESDLRVADVCTGTGIWLLQVAHQYPNSNLEGLDISLAEAPKRNWCPQNVRFQEFDLFADLPSDLTERYDTINVQYTHLFVRDAMIESVLHKLSSMLKPGGWLQYTDMDARNIQVLMPKGDHPPSAISTVVQSAWDAVGFVPNAWTSNLEDLLTATGFVDVVRRSPELPPPTLVPSTQSALWGIEEGCLTMLAKGLATREDMKGLMDKVGQAWREHKEAGAVIDMRTFRCVGMKPQDSAQSRARNFATSRGAGSKLQLPVGILASGPIL